MGQQQPSGESSISSASSKLILLVLQLRWLVRRAVQQQHCSKTQQEKSAFQEQALPCELLWKEGPKRSTEMVMPATIIRLILPEFVLCRVSLCVAALNLTVEALNQQISMLKIRTAM